MSTKVATNLVYISNVTYGEVPSIPLVLGYSAGLQELELQEKVLPTHNLVSPSFSDKVDLLLQGKNTLIVDGLRDLSNSITLVIPLPL